MAIKFDVYSNAGEGTDSTGLYLDGASPTVPAIDLTNTGISFASGDVINAHVVYDGTTLHLTLTDAVIGKVYTTSFAVNLPSVVGANSAYVGFTGGTGGLTASQKILTWTFSSSSQTTPSSVQYETQSLSAVSSGPTYRTFAWSAFPDGTGTILDATRIGDNVTYTVNVAQAGTYDLHVSTKNWNIRGIWQLSIDGTNVGLPVDEYNPSETYANYDLGLITIPVAGRHSFKFTVTGRNPLSQDYKIAFDDFRLDPR